MNAIERRVIRAYEAKKMNDRRSILFDMKQPVQE
jgi:hypothetical protein